MTTEIQVDEQAEVFYKGRTKNPMQVTCPVCGVIHIHQESVTLHPGYNESPEKNEKTIELNSRGQVNHISKPVMGIDAGRRYAFESRFIGECGHEFSIVFQQHKGEMFITVANAVENFEDTRDYY